MKSILDFIRGLFFSNSFSLGNDAILPLNRGLSFGSNLISKTLTATNSLGALTFGLKQYWREITPGGEAGSASQNTFYDNDFTAAYLDGTVLSNNNTTRTFLTDTRVQFVGTGTWDYVFQTNVAAKVPHFVIELKIVDVENTGGAGSYGFAAAVWVKSATYRIEARYDYVTSTFLLLEYINGVVGASSSVALAGFTTPGSVYLVVMGEIVSLWAKGGTLLKATHLTTMNLTLIDPKNVTDNQAFRVGFSTASDNAGTVILNGLRASYMGGIGLREFRPVIWDDLAPVMVDGEVLCTWDWAGVSNNGWPDARQADPTPGVLGFLNPTTGKLREISRFGVVRGGRNYQAVELSITLERVTRKAHIFFQAWTNGSGASYPAEGLIPLYQEWSEDILKPGINMLLDVTPVTMPATYDHDFYDLTVWKGTDGFWYMGGTWSSTTRLTDPGALAGVNVFKGTAPNVMTAHVVAVDPAPNGNRYNGEGCRIIKWGLVTYAIFSIRTNGSIHAWSFSDDYSTLTHVGAATVALVSTAYQNGSLPGMPAIFAIPDGDYTRAVYTDFHNVTLLGGDIASSGAFLMFTSAERNLGWEHPFRKLT